MKQHYGIVKSAKIINVVSAALMSLAGLLLLVVPTLEVSGAQRILFGCLFGLTGAAKLFGYFSNDLYRLAFQFDFAIGVFCEFLMVLIFLLPETTFIYLPTLVSVYILLDGLLKLQTSLDARRFGMRRWLIILLTALLLCLGGGFAVYTLSVGILRNVAVIGGILIADGLENIWITAYTVRIRAKKKNVSEHFGLDELEK